jgi:hypothetical protein
MPRFHCSSASARTIILMKKKPMSVSGSAVNNLENQALSQLNAGKYKEAIELYKKLLKDADNSDWRQQLAYCYLQRASAFAARGMYKEALGLWENYSQQAQPPYEKYDHYLAWLIQTKNPANIQSALQRLSARQLDKDYPGLAALLGLLIITRHPEFQQALPQDADFMAHLGVVRTALQAYQDNNPAGVEEALKQLPYRSAFRDFRTLLKAALTLPASPGEAQSLLDKIPANSPYAQTASLLQTCTLNGRALVREMARFNRQQRGLIGDIMGLDQKQSDFIEQLSRHKDRLSDKLKFNLAAQYRSLCGPESARRFCFALLTRYPAGQRDFEKLFGPIDEFEHNRLKALACEQENNDAEYYWRQCIRILARERDPGNDLKIALILRHLAEQQPDSEEKNQLLVESLQYDPDDRASYLLILDYYGQSPDTAESYKQWLDDTLARFPLDLEVLTLAVQAAMRDNAYKKASQYARKILKIDPLNTFAKQTLFACHLARARKLIQGKKYPAVEQEIQQAEDLKMGKSYALQMQLMRGLFCFAAQDKPQGLQLIAEALDKLNTDPVNMHFQAAMEAQLTNLPVATLLRELPPARDYLLSGQELARLIERLKQYGRDADSRERLHKALDKVKAPLKKSLQQQDYDEALLLTLCEALDDIRHFELLRHCVKVAQAKWHKPIWNYYLVYAGTSGCPERCSYGQILSLETNREVARLEKDHRTMMLIDHYLKRYHEAHPSMGLGFFDSLLPPDEQPGAEDPFDRLFGHLPDEIFDKLNKKLEALAKKTSPERLVQELAGVVGDDSKLMQAIMLDPDLFTALMIVKAAGDLGINIDVSVDDVLACFDVGKKPGRFPF